MAFSLKHIPEWNALEIKQNGKNTKSVHDRYNNYIDGLDTKYQVDDWTWYIPDWEFDRWMSMFSEITTMTQTVGSIRGTEEPITPDIDYKLKHKDKMKLPPYPFQEVGANFLVDKERAIVGDEMGLGKAQPLSAQLATPDGWKTMGEIQPGDEVFGVDGFPQKVVGCYPQGEEDVYEITFDDGTTTRSSGDHLWTIQTFNDRYKHDGRWRTVKLDDIHTQLEGTSDRFKVFIPMTSPVEYPERSYLVDPYLMGYLIGDGEFLHRERVELLIHGDDSKRLLEKELPEEVWIRSYPGRKQKYYLEEGENEPVFTALRQYGLHQCRQEATFIPEDYLLGSYAQRLALLQGLMDADGHSPGSKVAEHSTTSKQLSEDVAELVQSLGGVATPFVSELSSKDSVRIMYRLTVTVPSGMKVFRLKRKLKEQPLERKYQYNRSIVSIEHIGQEETQCIEVENKDGLYLTDHYIVTHNTMSALTAFNDLYHEGKAEKGLLVVPASLKYQWANEVEKFTDFTSIVIDGTKKKRRKQYKAYEEEEDQFAILSYETLRNDIDLAESLPMDVLVFDEAHRLSNRSTKLYKAIERLSSDYLFLLTGTPMQNKLEELFALFKLIDKDILGGVTKFKKKHYVVGEKFGRRFIELGYKNLDEVREKTSPYLIRRTKAEVAPELPREVHKKVYVDMNNKQKELYKEIEDDFKRFQEDIQDFYETQSDADAREGKKHEKEDMVLGYLYMLQAVSNHPMQLAKSGSKMAQNYLPFIREARNSAKLDELMDILETLMEEKSKVIIFSQYTSMLEIIYNHIFTHFNFYPYVIHGGIKSKDRTQAVDDFSKHPMKNIMLLSDAGNYGLNIQAADTLINFDNPWNPAVAA